MSKFTKHLLVLGAALLLSLSPAIGQGGGIGGGGDRPPPSGGGGDGGGSGGGSKQPDKGHSGEGGGGLAPQPSGGGGGGHEGSQSADSEQGKALDEQSDEHAEETSAEADETVHSEDVAFYFSLACDEYADE